MYRVMSKRWVGGSPPQYGGRTAFSYVGSDFKGECYLRYRYAGANRFAKFVSYSEALSAATRGLFLPAHIEISDVLITKDGPNDAAIFSNAHTWYESLGAVPIYDNH